jgi:electron transfer flavoprotein beta subunit
MKLLVFLDVAADVRIPPECDPRTGRVRQDRLVAEIDPAGARALDVALGLAAGRPNGEVTVINVGPPEHDSFLRQAVGRGCNRAIRAWDEEAGAARTAGKAAVLAAAAQAAGFDLVLAGDRGVITRGGQLGVLVAAQLGILCVTEVGSAVLSADSRRLAAIRELERGFQERVEVALPALLTVTPGATGEAASSAAIPARALLAALEQEISVWTLADLGVAPGVVRDVDRPLQSEPPRPRRPRLHPVASPDPSLPAFDRILGLVSGSVKHREGRVVRKSAGEVAQEMFEVLRDEGWLDHLRPDSARPAAGHSRLAGSAADRGADPAADSAAVPARPTPEAGDSR